MQDLVVNERLTIPSRELRWRFSRSSGPGGQGVNTTDSRVELLLDLANCSCLGPFRRARLLEHFQARLGGGLPTGCGRRRTLPMAEPTQGSASHGGAAAGGLAASTACPKGHPAGSWCREAALGHEEKAW